MKHKWNCKSLVLLALSVILAIYILTSSYTKSFILNLGSLSYLGAFISGIFFAFGFTAAPATASILLLGKTASPIALALIGGTGAMLSDFLIFSYVKSKMSPDIKYILKKTKVDKIKKIRHTKLGWILPVLGAGIIASPLPDELGSFLLGISHFSTKKFLILSYVMNSLGIMILAFIGKI
jgi:hypothetical protein